MPVIKFKKRKGHTPPSGVPHGEDRTSNTYRSLA